MTHGSKQHIVCSGTLTRKKMLGVMILAGTALILPGILFSQPPSASSTQHQNTESVYSVTTETKDGILIHATAEPYKLSFSVKGPIKWGQPVPLLVTRDVIAEWMKDPQRAMSVADKLMVFSKSFVKPNFVEIRDISFDMVSLRFMFLGAEDPKRRIKVTVTLKDADNRALYSASKACSDQRIYAKTHKGWLSRVQNVLSMENYVMVEFDPALLKSINGIDVIFEEVRQTQCAGHRVYPGEFQI